MELNATILGEIIGFIVFFAPFVWVCRSGVVSGYHKLIWFLLTLFLSWVGCLAYYFMVAKPKQSALTQ